MKEVSSLPAVSKAVKNRCFDIVFGELFTNDKQLLIEQLSEVEYLHSTDFAVLKIPPITEISFIINLKTSRVFNYSVSKYRHLLEDVYLLEVIRYRDELISESNNQFNTSFTYEDFGFDSEEVRVYRLLRLNDLTSKHLSFLDDVVSWQDEIVTVVGESESVKKLEFVNSENIHYYQLIDTNNLVITDSFISIEATLKGGLKILKTLVPTIVTDTNFKRMIDYNILPVLSFMNYELVNESLLLIKEFPVGQYFYCLDSYRRARSNIKLEKWELINNEIICHSIDGKVAKLDRVTMKLSPWQVA